MVCAWGSGGGATTIAARDPPQPFQRRRAAQREPPALVQLGGLRVERGDRALGFRDEVGGQAAASAPAPQPTSSTPDAMG
ncbi:hypothetical protein [Jiangella asiatica]|uniref:hypothetical protein n=1 Tax=Jiangella asiatica TaxID=2530372 RepID=UPI0013A5EB01|nr:hypothetical protein [Jiangella asiatica]